MEQVSTFNYSRDSPVCLVTSLRAGRSGNRGWSPGSE